MENKKRMLSQDIAKAIVILSVVITHTLGIRDIQHPLTWFNYLIMCPMGFFFVISGYNYHPGKRTAGQSVWIRFKQLIVPLVLYTAFFTVLAIILNLTAQYSTMSQIGKAAYFAVTGSGLEKSILFTHILNDTERAAFYIPSWFLVYMFMGYIIFFFIVDFAMKNNKRFISVVIGLIAITMLLFKFLNDVANPLGIINAPFIACLLLLGCYLGNKKFLETETFGKKWTIINAVVAGVLCFVLALLEPRVCMIGAGRLGRVFGAAEIPLTAVVAILYTYALINFCKLFEKIPVLTPCLTWFGRNSLRIFLLHMPISSLVTFIFGIKGTSFDGPEQTVGEFFTLFGLTFAFTVVATLIIDFSMQFIHKKINQKKLQKANANVSNEGK